uniref:C-type lectin domain-containing protein n=1 Tax=Setaria digitata TaxID=48799 RepID=A0A915PCG1_9BILA
MTLLREMFSDCRKNSECKSDQICDKGRCIPDLLPMLATGALRKPKPSCTVDRHCEPPHKCSHGLCVKNIDTLANLYSPERRIPTSLESKKSYALRKMKLEAKYKLPFGRASETQRKMLSDGMNSAISFALDEPNSHISKDEEVQKLSETNVSNEGEMQMPNAAESNVANEGEAQALNEAEAQISNDEKSQTLNEKESQTLDSGKLSTLNDVEQSDETISSMTTAMYDSETITTELDFSFLEEGTCIVNANCENGEICRDKKCVPVDWLPNTLVCVNDSQCTPQQLCALDGYCVLDPSFPKFGPRCDSNADCKKPGICRNGRCHISYPYKKCKINEQCAIDEICVMNGYCVPDPHFKQHGTDAIKISFISDIYHAGGNGAYWIGLLKDLDGSLKWQSNERVIYTNWDKHEPEPRIGCILADLINRSGKWAVVDCIGLHYPDQGFVCETDIRRN